MFLNTSASWVNSARKDAGKYLHISTILLLSPDDVFKLSSAYKSKPRNQAKTPHKSAG